MSTNRTGERGSVPSRNDRFFKRYEYWYYNTREGVEIGPFDSFDHAKLGARDFIEYVNKGGADKVAILAKYGRYAA